MLLQITIILFFISYLMSTKIGNYSQNITDYNECGVSRNLNFEPNFCFENKYDFNPDIKDRRYAGDGEAPWVAFIYGKYKSKDSFTVYANKWALEREGINASKKIKHPRYIELENLDKSDPNRGDRYAYDIGLLKLEKAINMENENDVKVRGTICLPSKEFGFNQPQLATLAGWGLKAQDLEIASFKMEIFKQWSLSRLQFTSVFGKIRACPGDSGSGYYMYERGRAFLIGVQATAFKENDNECSRSGTAVFVPNFIDWILETIKNNTY